MMTLDEAIDHARKYGKNMIRKCETKSCGLEHIQLADWLQKLKELRMKVNR